VGRFRCETVMVRRVEWGEIEFSDTHTIRLLRFADKCETTFWRWWAPRGSYPAWSSFRTALKDHRNLSYTQVFELAERAEIPHSSRILTAQELEAKMEARKNMKIMEEKNVTNKSGRGKGSRNSV